MYWRLVPLLVCLPAMAWAQDSVMEVDSTQEQPGESDTQEIGVQLGAAVGGPVTPGGITAEGRYLYRFSDLDWLETGVGFTFGSSSAECYRDRSGDFTCDHGVVDGFAGEASVGIRRYLQGQDKFRPFARAGLGVRVISFAADDVMGVAFPLYLGGGVRAHVANRVHVVADATVRGGVGIFGHDIGLAPALSLAITAGVEFTLE